MVAKYCFLQCVKNLCETIQLPHSEIVMLGRNGTTMLTDLTLSKRQVSVMADLDAAEVIVKQLGSGVSGCNGFALLKDKTYKFGHGDQLELQLGKYEYNIIFDPPPVQQNGLDISLKRSCPSPEENMIKRSIKDVLQNKSNEIIVNGDAKWSGSWEDESDNHLLIFSSFNVESRSSIAAFDLDGTIIRTKSGSRFPKDANDWMFNYIAVVKKLQRLHSDKFKVVIFTNQAGIGQSKQKQKIFKSKVENICAKINIPMQVFVATSYDIYRKPAPGMWDHLVKYKNDNIEIDMCNSFFVGDAAGRQKNWAPNKKKDHSIADRLFAINLGINFMTPEEYFLANKRVPFEMPNFDPRKLALEYKIAKFAHPEVIIMVGGPGSGKTHFCKNQLIPNGYTHISRDLLGTWQRCVAVLEENLKKKCSAVIDNTNSSVESRKRFIDTARNYNISCRCFVMKTSSEHSKHNNRFREITDKRHAQISDIIINSYKKSYEEPKTSEGFTEVVQIDFMPKFDNPEYEHLYKMFLLG